MGSGTSKEVVLPANPSASNAFAERAAHEAAEHDRRSREASAALRDA
jgi:hypothetical protein